MRPSNTRSILFAAALTALGFSLGGYTALGISGAEVRKQAYIDYCDAHPELLDCAWFAAGGVDFTQIDQVRFEQSNLDARIKALVAIDPALAQAYDTASLTAISMPTLLVNLG